MKMNLRFIDGKMTCIMQMNRLGAFARLNGSARHSDDLDLVVKDDICLLAGAMRIQWQPATLFNYVNQQERGME